MIFIRPSMVEITIKQLLTLCRKPLGIWMGEVRIEIELPSEERREPPKHAEHNAKKDLSAVFAILQVDLNR